MVKRNRGLEIVCYFSMLILGIQVIGFQFILADIAREFSMNKTAMGAIAGAQFAPNVIVPLLLGGLVDRVDKRVISMFCAVAYLVGSIVVIFSKSVFMLVAGILILGSGGVMFPAVFTVMLAETEPQRSSFFASMVETSFSIGSVVGPLLLSFLMKEGMEWRGLYYIVAGMSVLAALAFSLSKSPVKAKRSGIAPAERGTIRSVMNRFGILLILFGGVYYMVEGGFTTFLNSYFEDVLRDVQNGSLALSLFGLAMAVMRIATSKVTRNREKLIMAGCLGAGAAALAMVFIRQYTLVWCVLFGLMAAPCWPLMMSTAVDAFPHSSGRIATLIMVGNGVGGVLVSPVMGFISDRTDVAASYLSVVASAILAALLFLIFLREKNRRQSKVGSTL